MALKNFAFKILNKDKFKTFPDFQNANQKLIDDALKQVDIDVGIVNVYKYLGGYDPKDKKKIFSWLFFYVIAFKIASRVVFIISLASDSLMQYGGIK